MVYVSTAQITQYCEVVRSDLDDSVDAAAFTALITQFEVLAHAIIDKYCQHDFTEHDNTGVNAITISVGNFPRHLVTVDGPILSVTSVYTRDTKGDDWTELDDDSWSYKNKAGTGTISKIAATAVSDLYDIHRRVSHWKPEWYAGYENIKIEYKWGYAAVPDDIQYVTLELVSRMLRYKVQRRNQRVIVVPNMSMTTNTMDLLTDYLKMLLDPYKFSKVTVRAI